MSTMPQFQDLSHALVSAAVVYTDRLKEVRRLTNQGRMRNIEDVERSGGVAAKMIPTRTRRKDLQAPAVREGWIGENDFKNTFEKYATVKKLSCSAGADCARIYLSHANDEFSTRRLLVHYRCKRHRKTVDVVISRDDLHDTL
jgi:hypothetical protein